MKFLLAVSFLAMCLVLVSSHFAGRRPFRQGYDRDTGSQEVFREFQRDRGGYYEPPAASRATQVPNCKKNGESCSSSSDCCMCTTQGGYYSCMICSSATTPKKCFRWNHNIITGRTDVCNVSTAFHLLWSEGWQCHGKVLRVASTVWMKSINMLWFLILLVFFSVFVP